MKAFTSVVSCLLLFINSHSQTCSDCRYLTPLFDSVTVDRNILFAEGKNSDGQMQQLYMDVYQPYGDTLSARPVMIFAFGGGFVQGSKEDWYVQVVCDYFARTGYVSAAVDYRIGINPLEIITLQYMKIFFRPMQDMRAAIQYFKADYAELGNHYRVDTSKIILGGGSAGAITALMVSFCDKDTEIGEMGNVSILNDMGGFYSTSGFYDHYYWKPLATVNVAGALVNADWIEPGDNPVISMHGDADQVVPYKEGVYSLLSFSGFNLQGSYIVDSVARAKGVCSYLYTMQGKDHPSESILDYLIGVVNNVLLRMHAVVNNRSFCCNLDVNMIPDDTTFYQPGEPVNMSAQISNDNGNAHILWCSLPCFFTSDTAQVVFTGDTSMHLLSVIVDEGSCQAVDLNALSVGVPNTHTGISRLQEPGSFFIYPNPSSGWLNIHANALHATEVVKLDIFSLDGRKLFSREFKPEQPISVQNMGLKPGCYMLGLSSSTHVWQPQKLMLTE